MKILLQSSRKSRGPAFVLLRSAKLRVSVVRVILGKHEFGQRAIDEYSTGTSRNGALTG